MTNALQIKPHVDVFKSEGDFVDQLAASLQRIWPIRLVGREIRSHGRCRTDLAFAYDCDQVTSGLALVGIEAKLTNWARALRQAALNKYAVHLSYIAMPASRCTADVLAGAASLGIGVISLGEKGLTVALQARWEDPDLLLEKRMVSQLCKVRRRSSASRSFELWRSQDGVSA